MWPFQLNNFSNFFSEGDNPLSNAKSVLAEKLSLIKKRNIELEKKEKALEEAKNAVDEAKNAVHEANEEYAAAEFQVEIIKRKGHFEETFWRFPHIALNIFKKLDTVNLTKLRETNKWWKKFIDEQKIIPIREIQKNVYMSTRKLTRALEKESIETLKDLVKVSSAANKNAQKYLSKEHINNKECTDEVLHQLIENIPTPSCLLLLKLMLDQLKDKNPKSQFCNQTLLHRAAIIGKLEFYQLIMENVEDKNPKDGNGRTPLHLAAMHGHFDICKLIIENVDDVNPPDNHGITPLDYAKCRNHGDICKLIELAITKRKEETGNP